MAFMADNELFARAEIIPGSMRLEAWSELFNDEFAALRCLVDMVGETSDHRLYSPFTGELLMESEDDESAFADHLRFATPQVIIAETAKYGYGLSHA